MWLENCVAYSTHTWEKEIAENCERAEETMPKKGKNRYLELPNSYKPTYVRAKISEESLDVLDEQSEESLGI